MTYRKLSIEVKLYVFKSIAAASKTFSSLLSLQSSSTARPGSEPQSWGSMVKAGTSLPLTRAGELSTGKLGL